MSIKSLLTPGPKQWANLIVNSLAFTSGAVIGDYVEQEVNTVWSGPFSDPEIVKMKFALIGDILIITSPIVSRPTDKFSFINITGIPSEFHPTTAYTGTIWVKNRNLAGVSIETLGFILFRTNGTMLIAEGRRSQFRGLNNIKLGALAFSIAVNKNTTGEDVFDEEFLYGLNPEVLEVLTEARMDNIQELTLNAGVTIDQIRAIDDCVQMNCWEPILAGPAVGVFIQENSNLDVTNRQDYLLNDPAGRSQIWHHVTRDPDPFNAGNTYAGLGPLIKSGAGSFLGDTFEQISEGSEFAGIPDGSAFAMSASNWALNRMKPFSYVLRKNTGSGVFNNLLIDGDSLIYRTDAEGFAGSDILVADDNRISLNKPVSIGDEKTPINCELYIETTGSSNVAIVADSDGGGGIQGPNFALTNMAGTEGFFLSISSIGGFNTQTFGAGDYLISTGGTLDPFVSGTFPSVFANATAALRINSSQVVSINNQLLVDTIQNLTATDMTISSNNGDLILIAPGGDIIAEGITVNGTGIKVDEIRESTPANGVEFPDDLKTDIIDERTGAAGVTVDGVLVKDNSVLFSPGQTALDHYTEVTHNSDLTGIWAVDQAAVFELTRIGRTVTMTLEVDVTATANAAALITIVTPIPVDYRPLVGSRIEFAAIEDNAAPNAGSTEITTGGVVTWASRVSNINFAGAGNSGLLTGSISWSI